MHVFFDTEFTHFRDGELLSIALLAEDGESLVVELQDPALHARASDFCKQHVLPQFGMLPSKVVRTSLEAGEVLAQWLARLEGPLIMCFDYKLDWHFLVDSLQAAGAEQLVRDHLQPLNVADFAKFEACLTAQEQFFVGRHSPGRHHPLVDAYALRERWLLYVQLTAAPSAA